MVSKLFIAMCMLNTAMFVYAAEPEMVILPGDLYIGGLFDIGFPDLEQSDSCETDAIDVSSVMELEAVKWAIQKLNRYNYIPGIKLGLWAYKTCQMPGMASLRTNDFIEQQQRWLTQHVYTGHGAANITNIVGIIGPTFSSESDVVSRMISSLPSEFQIPQVSYSSTASFLGDRHVYRNFFRTIPSDDLQFAAMRQLILKLQWNYLTIVHSNDRYGHDGAEKLREWIEHDGVCIDAVLKYNNTNYQVSLSELMDILRNITVRAVKGVIFIGGSRAASVFMYIVDRELQGLSEVPLFIFSESAGLQQQVFMDTQNLRVRPASKGVLILSPPSVNIKEFQGHWDSIFSNETKLAEESISNPWLLSVSRDAMIRNRKFRTSENSDPSSFNTLVQEHSFVSYAIKAIYALAKNVKEVVQQKCPQETGDCVIRIQSVASDEFLQHLQGIQVDFSRDFHGAEIPEFLSTSKLRFTTSGEVDFYSEDISQYQIYNYRSCPGIDSSFCFVKVADLKKNNKLEMNMTTLKGYSKSGKELSYYKQAHCQPGRTCSVCLPPHNMERSLYIDGDLIVVVTFPIHEKGKVPMECGDIRSIIGLDVALGAQFAVRKVNEKIGEYRNIFPNKTIGLLMMDSCDDPMVITEKILNLHLTGTVHGAPENIASRIIGYVGDLGSSTTAAVAEISTQFKFVQISCCATTNLLDNRNTYPYFVRLSTPVDKTASVMLQIVKDIGANYIQVLYSACKYGESGKFAIRNQLKTYNTCVAQYKEVREDTTYSLLLENLRNYPSARVVIVFLRSHVVHKVLEAITDRMQIGEFHFIGSDGWATRYNMLKIPKLIGSISVADEMIISDEYKTFFNNLQPVPNDTNAWLMQFMQKRLGCYFPQSFDKSLDRECDSNDRLPGKIEDHLDLSTPYLINSVYALLRGSHQALLRLCGREQSLCSAYKNNPAEVLRSIKNVTLDLNGYGRSTPVFDENGNGVFGLKIYNIQKDHTDPLKLSYKNVGVWTADGIYEFGRQLLVFPGDRNVSTCDNTYRCFPCLYYKQQSKTETIPTPTVNQSSELGAPTITIIVLGALLLVIIVTFLVVCRRYKVLNTYKVPSYRSSEVKSEAYHSIRDIGHLNHVNSEVSIGTPHSRRHDTASSLGTPTTERFMPGTPPTHHLQSQTGLNVHRFNLESPNTPKNTRRLNSAPLPAIPTHENRSNSSPYILATVTAANTRFSEPTLGSSNVNYILRRHASSTVEEQAETEVFADNGYILPLSDPNTGSKANKAIQHTNVEFTVGD